MVELNKFHFAMITIYESKKKDNSQDFATQDKLEFEKEKKDSEQSRLNSKEDETWIFTPYTLSFLNKLEERLKKDGSQSQTYISVSEVLGGLARLYERIRNLVEYKGEHVLRRNAIERILKRLVWEKESVRTGLDERRVSESLIKELIWARYLANDSIPEDKISVIEKVISKYLFIFKDLENFPSQVSASKIRDWIWGIASSEIEDTLEPSYREIYVNLMSEWFKDNFDWSDKGLSQHEKDLQIYLAVHRAFTKSDEAIMRYHLLLKEVPNWQYLNYAEIQRFIHNFPRIYIEIEKHINFPGNLILYRIVSRHTASFEVFKEIVKSHPLNLKEILLIKDEFEEVVKNVCGNKYATMKQRVQTAVARSIIYIFLSKIVFAILIEIPYEVLIYGDVRYLPLSINIIFPAFMMFLIGFSIKVPDARNTESIVKRLNSVIYKGYQNPKVSFSLEKSTRNSGLYFIFWFFYSILFMVVFGGITAFLIFLNFSFFGIFVFFMFLSLVLLFAYRVRFYATQLKVEEDKEGFLSHLTSYVTLPLLNFGSYLSKALSRFNFLAIILDFLIEIPLKNMIEIFEEWTSFLKEKKEEVVEVPE